MTQGTKVGLLLSLVILIVVLVLLSDHVAMINDAKPARVTEVGPQVAQAIATPGANAVEPPRPVASEIVVPAQPIPIVQEMVPRPATPLQIDIGPAQTRELDIRAARNNVPVNVQPVQIDSGVSVMSLADAGKPADITRIADFVPLSTETAQMQPVPLAAAPAPKGFDHKAMPGDTVSKLARKYYGLDTKGNRELIIAANPSLKANPNKIVVGKSYVVPVKPGNISAAQAAAAPIAASVITPVAAPAKTEIAAPAVSKPAAQATRTYVVKPGDNLWKIAREQCNSSSKVAELKKLNAGVLRSGTELKVGTTLRLPPK